MVGAVRFELTTSCTPSKRAYQATLRPDLVLLASTPIFANDREPANIYFARLYAKGKLICLSLNGKASCIAQCNAK
jgi:hypothetical protein